MRSSPTDGADAGAPKAYDTMVNKSASSRAMSGLHTYAIHQHGQIKLINQAHKSDHMRLRRVCVCVCAYVCVLLHARVSAAGQHTSLLQVADGAPCKRLRVVS
jgi:hypothetical protein